MKKYIISIFVLLCLTYINPEPQKMIYIEQIYRLYESNLNATQTNYKRNIFWLENSLKLPHIHPTQAIVMTNTWDEYVKYKLLLRFHVLFLLTKEYMNWGWEYDKRDVVFYNIEWANELRESFGIAKHLYEQARFYWKETKIWSEQAYKIDKYIGWDQIEELNYKIENDEFDYDYEDMIELRLESINNKLKKIDDYLAANPAK